jgi:hypothetical protein
MKFKKAILIMLLLVILTITAVNASDNVTEVSSTEENIDEELQTIDINELESEESNSECLTVIISDEELNQSCENDLLEMSNENSNKLNSSCNGEILSDDGSNSQEYVGSISVGYEEVFFNYENVLIDVGLKDHYKNVVYGYVDIYIDGKYYKRMSINHDIETLSLGKLKTGKHIIKVQPKESFFNEIKISVIKNQISKKSSSSKKKAKTKKKKSKYKKFKSRSGYKWKIKRSKWKKMKKQAINNRKFFKSVGSGMAGYSNSINVKVTKKGHTYKGIALAVKGSRGLGCEVRGVKLGLRISTLGDYYV